MDYDVLLYYPNIIGYIRLILVFISLLLFNNVQWFLGFYIVSVVLDAVDGIVARKFNQTSVFGAWFDVVIDLISRGALWCFLSPWGYFIMLIEWMTFVATHTRGANWKIPDEEFPWICKKVMANGFKTTTGTYAITGIFVLPLWLYGIQSKFLTDTIAMPLLVQYLLCVFLIGGRFLAFVTEAFFIWQHIKAMLLEEVKLKDVKANDTR